MSRATESQLDKLHAQIAAVLVNELDRATYRATQAPDDPASAVSPQLISQALKFLSQAGVTAPASAPRTVDLVEQLKECGIDLDDEKLGANRPN